MYRYIMRGETRTTSGALLAGAVQLMIRIRSRRQQLCGGSRCLELRDPLAVEPVKRLLGDCKLGGTTTRPREGEEG